MNREAITRLKDLAQKANPGLWRYVPGHPHRVVTENENWPICDVEGFNDSAFIAANPRTILHLIADYERLEKEADWLAELHHCRCAECDCPEHCCFDRGCNCPVAGRIAREYWRKAAREAVEAQCKSN